jgi:hypothetical protein
MKAGEALALIDELTEIAMGDTRATKRAGRERQNDLERAREICTKLESAPGVPELVREKVGSLSSWVKALSKGIDGIELEAIFADQVAARDRPTSD